MNGLSKAEIAAFNQAFAEILPKLEWERAPLPEQAPPDAFGYLGLAPGWTVPVVEFPHPDAPAQRGYDGAATMRGTIWHLTQEQSEAACKAARAALDTKPE